MYMSVFSTIIQLIKLLSRDLKYIITKKLTFLLCICFVFIFYSGGVMHRVVSSSNLYTKVFILTHLIIFSNISLLLMLITSRKLFINLIQSHNFFVPNSFPLIKYSIFLFVLCSLDIFTKFIINYTYISEIVFFCVLVFDYNMLYYTYFIASRRNKPGLNIYIKRILIATLLYIIYVILDSLAVGFCTYIIIKFSNGIQLLFNTQAIIKTLGAIILGVLNARLSFILIQNHLFEPKNRGDNPIYILGQE